MKTLNKHLTLYVDKEYNTHVIETELANKYGQKK